MLACLAVSRFEYEQAKDACLRSQEKHKSGLTELH
jgi:hypothetical protein